MALCPGQTPPCYPHAGCFFSTLLNGQRVLLDDHGELTRVENKHGSYVELSPKQVTVHAEGTGLTIQAPGHPLVIRAKSVDFEDA